MNNYIILIAVLTLVIVFFIIDNIMDKKEEKNNKPEIVTGISLGEVLTDLNLLISIYIEDYKKINKLGDGEIYMNNDRLTSSVENLSNEIINSLSADFVRKLNLFITPEAIMIYVTHTVMNEMGIYAQEINEPS